MPFLSMVRRAALLTRRLIQRFSLSSQNRRYCKFGRNRRLVLLFAWETLFPVIGFLPVIWQTRAMVIPRIVQGGEYAIYPTCGSSRSTSPATFRKENSHESLCAGSHSTLFSFLLVCRNDIRRLVTYLDVSAERTGQVDSGFQHGPATSSSRGGTPLVGSGILHQ